MIKLISIIFPFLLLDACFQIGPKFYYEIKNESLYPIEINVFTKGNLKELIQIDSNKSYIEKTNSKNHISPFSDSADSIVIVFDKKKVIIQYCQGRPLIGSTPVCGEIEDNLSDFNFGICKSGNIFHGSSMKITFDDFDFARAIPL